MDIPAALDRERPQVSGEYPVAVDLRRRAPSSASMPAVRLVRPDIRRTPAAGIPAGAPTRLDVPRRYGSVEMAAVARPPSLELEARRYDSVEMEAVAPPPPTGRMLDDDLDFDFDFHADGALELDDRPSSQSMRDESSRSPGLGAPPPRRTSPGPAPRSTPNPPRSAGARQPPTVPGEPPAQPWATRGPARSSGTLPAHDAHAALVAFAGFGEPPSTIWGAPAYALRVHLRRRALRSGLKLARQRRSADIGLYEASLRAADDAAVSHGRTFAAALFLFALVVVVATAELVTGALPLPW
jgi:hypothetical protein